MMVKVYSCGISGLDAYPVTIEVDVSRGLPSTTIVGLPDNAVRESKERVRSAIKNSGYKFPIQRTTINLSPADIKKEGASFDLGLAIGILAATGQISATTLKNHIFLGELSLDGTVQSITGSLSAALSLSNGTIKKLLVPASNADEAAIVDHIAVYPVKSLNDAIYFLSCPDDKPPVRVHLTDLFHRANQYSIDFADVKGQSHVKRGLEIAAAGGHNCLMLWTQYYLLTKILPRDG